MRADRLVSVLLLMQAHGRVTAAELAEQLEISVATARRDLEALSTAGIPVYPQPGRGGGWSLVGGSRTDLTGLTAAEAQALFLLVGPTSGRAPEATSALRKLVRALPETFRADAEAAAGAVLVDRSRWGRTPHDELAPAALADLQAAVVRRRQVGFRYREAAAPRTVDPWALVDKDGTWYLLAGTPAGRRTFRVDRISGVEVLASTFPRPPALDVAAMWDEVVDAVEARRTAVTAQVLVPGRLVPVLEGQLGRACRVVGTESDGRTRMEVSAHMARAVAEQLAGHGTSIEVVSPPAVVDELARIGRELVDAYGV
ncbi:helix-turn-helix transcriptional regulator [Cellulomonas rhizosphaerae]|uniref:YafY family transcriptional regulator n=1 Tax=Cellulomonas rhizosphaerae TaxID=2293719 RepID=A0A413RHT5_9CELL|nr:YafY family protein [Cellulomonas rhizosphaerae]RHA37763.1 YafY family transcriptional regulator [Cellulomonas rhizosphaerae]